MASDISSVIAPEESESASERTQANGRIRKRYIAAIESLAPKLVVFIGVSENYGRDSLPPSQTAKSNRVKQFGRLCGIDSGHAADAEFAFCAGFVRTANAE